MSLSNTSHSPDGFEKKNFFTILVIHNIYTPLSNLEYKAYKIEASVNK
jgi:hypothetical protein